MDTRQFLQRRLITPEWMDEPDLDASLHRQALAGLRRVNWWSGTAGNVSREIAQLARQRQRGGDIAAPPLRILDLACGGGDVTVRVARILRRKKIASVIEGWDRSPTALDLARGLTARDGRLPVTFHEHDVMCDPIPRDFDVIYSTLFLHHLATPDVVIFLQRMAEAARSLVVVDDLCRSRIGWYLARYGSQILSRSPVVHFDGPASVQAALHIDEVRPLAAAAGMRHVTLRRHWPQRFLMCWTRAV